MEQKKIQDVLCFRSVFFPIPDLLFFQQNDIIRKNDKAGIQMNRDPKIRSSAEDYLETILILHNRKGVVRSIDIANELGYSKPSVSIAMKNLREGNCISVSPEGFITLLPKGREIAERIYERHTVLSDLLAAMGVPADIAAEDACRVEHVISVESFNAINEYAAKLGVPVDS